jgi:hypothetical protein
MPPFYVRAEKEILASTSHVQDRTYPLAGLKRTPLIADKTNATILRQSHGFAFVKNARMNETAVDKMKAKALWEIWRYRNRGPC